MIVTTVGLFSTGRKDKSQTVVKKTIAHQYVSLNIANVIDLRVITSLSCYT